MTEPNPTNPTESVVDQFRRKIAEADKQTRAILIVGSFSPCAPACLALAAQLSLTNALIAFEEACVQTRQEYQELTQALDAFPFTAPVFEYGRMAQGIGYNVVMTGPASHRTRRQGRRGSYNAALDRIICKAAYC